MTTNLNQTPSANRTHIGIFGKRNAGKSSLINAITGQNYAIVSDVLGTTTDPVLKSMELLPLGPVVIIDTPGEYLQSKNLISALAVFTAEADVIGLLMDATEPFSLYSPNLTPVCNREVVGVVTKIDHWAAQPAQAAAWLELAGCKKIFYTSAYTGEGIADILSYLKEERDTLPWEEVKSKYDELGFGAGEDAKDQNRFHNI